jgi:hypothetical protein
VRMWALLKPGWRSKGKESRVQRQGMRAWVRR